jgi:hypothetical protein
METYIGSGVSVKKTSVNILLKIGNRELYHIKYLFVLSYLVKIFLKFITIHIMYFNNMYIFVTVNRQCLHVFI